LDERAIYAELTTIFHDVFEDDDIVLRSDLTADDVDGWDSMSHVRLILTIKKRFNRSFPASRISQLANVGDLVRLIESGA
jgi:acyl carrier protein